MRFPLRHLPMSFLLVLAWSQTAVLAHAAAPKLYVALYRDNAVAVVDTATNTVLRTIPGLQRPEGVVISPDDRTVYVSNQGSSEVSAIDTSSDTVKASIEVGQRPEGLALTPDGATLLVAGFGSNSVRLVRTRDAAESEVAVPFPHSVTVSPDGTRAFVASQDPREPSIVVIDLTQGTVARTIPLAQVPRAITVSPEQQLYFTTVGSDAVQIFDLESNKSVGQIPAGETPHVAFFTPDLDTAMIIDRGTGSLFFFDPESNEVTDTTKVGDLPYGAAMNSVTIWVSNENSGTVSVVDLYAKTLTATISVGNGPRQLAVQHRQH